MATNILDDGSYYAIKQRMGIAPRRDGDDVGPLSAPPSEQAGHGQVAETSRKMRRHERTGEPIYANDPAPAMHRGQRDHPTEA
jgi:hypothetical protein